MTRTEARAAPQPSRLRIAWNAVTAEFAGEFAPLTPQQVAHARTLIGQGEPHDTVAESLNVSRRTLYRALRE